MNKQRQAVYGLRRQLLEGLDQKDLILEDYVASILGDLLAERIPEDKHPDEWDIDGLKNDVFTRFGVDFLAEGVDADKLNRAELGDAVFGKLKQRYDAKEQLIGPDAMRYHERMIMLSVLDAKWKDHLLDMDHLREGIGLRGYAQHDPLVEYKRESFQMFETMMTRFQEETVRYLYLMQLVEPSQARVRVTQPDFNSMNFEREQEAQRDRRLATTIDDIEAEFQLKKKRELQEASMAGAGDLAPVQQVRRSGDKVGRNDPCPCGSGKKYKKCCGA